MTERAGRRLPRGTVDIFGPQGIWHRRLPRARVTVKPDIEVEFQSATLELAAERIGDILVSYFLVRRYQHANRIRWVSVDRPNPRPRRDFQRQQDRVHSFPSELDPSAEVVVSRLVSIVPKLKLVISPMVSGRPS